VLIESAVRSLAIAVVLPLAQLGAELRREIQPWSTILKPRTQALVEYCLAETQTTGRTAGRKGSTKTAYRRYFSGKVSPDRSSSNKTLAIQKRPLQCTIWIELIPRVNG
jgi:hypothetical protein